MRDPCAGRGALGGEESGGRSGSRDPQRAGAGAARLPPAVPLPSEAPAARGLAWRRGHGHPSVAPGGRCCSSVVSAALPGLAGPREVSSEASDGAPRRELSGTGLRVPDGRVGGSGVPGPPAVFGGGRRRPALRGPERGNQKRDGEQLAEVRVLSCCGVFK